MWLAFRPGRSEQPLVVGHRWRWLFLKGLCLAAPTLDWASQVSRYVPLPLVIAEQRDRSGWWSPEISLSEGAIASAAT